MRIGGVSVGKVKELEPARGRQRDPRRDRDRSRVRADLLGRAGDPAPEDAARRDLHRADHRDPGRPGDGSRRRRDRRSPARPTSARSAATTRPSPIEEGGHLDDTQVAEQVQIDEIFNALDEETRQAFQLWMKNSGDRDRRPRPRPQRRLRQPRAVLRGRQRRARRRCASRSRRCGRRPQHRRRSSRR